MKAKDEIAAAVEALRKALGALDEEKQYHSRLGHIGHYRNSLRAMISSLEHLNSELGK